MHGTKMLVLRTDADNLVNNLDGIGILGVQTRNKSISLACLDHHHAEIVTLEHLIVSFLESVSVTLTFFGKDTSITLTTFLFIGVTQINNLDTIEAQVKRCSEFANILVVT